jgi:hypothetical protein
VYWTGITSDVKNALESYQHCQERLPSQPKEPLRRDPMPMRVFESTSADLFSFGGKMYMVYADRLSGFPFVKEWRKDPDASEVLKEVRRYYVDMGVPVQMRTDGGPQFAAKELRDFLKKWGVDPVLSTPHYPQSNGHAELSVKAMKNLVIKNSGGESFQQGLLEFRNTPISDGRSPAQVVFGHPMRSMVPAHYRSFANEWQQTAAEADETGAKLQI